MRRLDQGEVGAGGKKICVRRLDAKNRIVQWATILCTVHLSVGLVCARQKRCNFGSSTDPVNLVMHYHTNHSISQILRINPPHDQVSSLSAKPK